MSADVVGNGTRFFTVHVILPSNASESTPQAHSLSRSLTIKYKSQDSINDIWKRSIRQFKRGYGIECPPGLYWSRLQTNDGGDLFMDDTAGDLYRPDAPQTELQLRFILAHIEHESPLPHGSALRPPDFRKPEWSDLSREEQDHAGKLHSWTAINDPVSATAALTHAAQTTGANRIDADGFKIPGQPANTPRKSRIANAIAASQSSANDSQATVLVADSQPSRRHPPTPTSGPGPSQVSSSQISSNSTPPSAQRPLDSQASLPGVSVPATHLAEELPMMDYDPILDDELLGIESSQEQDRLPKASSPRASMTSSSHSAKASGSRTTIASTFRNTQASTFRNVAPQGKQPANSHCAESRPYIGKGKQPMTTATSNHTPSGSSLAPVNAFTIMQRSQSSGGISVKSKKRVDQKWTEEQEQLVLHGVRLNWTYEQIRKALMPTVDRSASSIRGKMKVMRARIEAGTLSWDVSSPLAPAAAPPSQATYSWTPGDVEKLRKGLRDGLDARQIQTRLFPSRSEESIIKKSRKETLRLEHLNSSQSRARAFDCASSQLTSSAPSQSFHQSSPAEAASTRRAADLLEHDLDDEELSSDSEDEKTVLDPSPINEDGDVEVDLLPKEEVRENHGESNEYELNDDMPVQAGPDIDIEARNSSLEAGREDVDEADDETPSTEPNKIRTLASESEIAAEGASRAQGETAYASPAESGEITGAQKLGNGASRKRKAFVALGDPPDMSGVIDMRRSNDGKLARQHQSGSESSRTLPKMEPVTSNRSDIIKAEPVESEDESDVMEIKREDNDRDDNSDKASDSGSASFVPYQKRRVFACIEELETFCARPSRDFDGVAQIIPDYTASLHMPDIRHGINPDGTEYTIVAPPYKEDEVLRPFRNVLSEMWKEALRKAKNDPAEALRRYKKDFTDNAMFKAIADQDNYRVAMIKELRQYRRRARARREGQEVDEDADLSSSWSGDQSSDEDAVDSSDGGEDEDSDVGRQEMDQSGGGGYAETVDNSDEESVDKTKGAIAKSGQPVVHDEEDEHAHRGSRLGQRISSESVLGAANAPSLSALASQPKTASLKRKASTSSSESEVSDHDSRRMPSGDHSKYISPIRNRAGEPVPRGVLSKHQVRRKRLSRRRKVSLEGDAQAGSSEMHNGKDKSVRPDDIEVKAAPELKKKPATTKEEKLERRHKKRQKKRGKERAARTEKEDQLTAPDSDTTSRRASSNSANQADKSMLNIIRKAKHVPGPKPKASQSSRPHLRHPSRMFGDSEEDEDVDGVDGSDEE